MDSQSKSGRRFKIRFTVSRRELSAAAALVLICVLSLDLSTESMTLTTYYPAPYGAYKELRATKNAYFAYVDDGSGNYGTVGVGPGGDALTHSDPDVRLHVTQDVALKRIVGVDSLGTGLNLPDDYFVDMGEVGPNETSASFQGNLAVGAGAASHSENANVDRVWLTKNYIHLPESLGGCIFKDEGVSTNLASCPSGTYATWQPGIYQDGKSYGTSFEVDVDLANGFNPPVGSSGNAIDVAFNPKTRYWCCPRAVP